MHDILHLVRCAPGSTLLRGCLACMYLKHMILSFKQKLPVVMQWYDHLLPFYTGLFSHFTFLYDLLLCFPDC